MQVAIAGVPGPLGRVDNSRDARCVAEVGRVDHLLDPGRECALDGPLCSIDLAQQRRGELGPTELDGELAGRRAGAVLAAQDR